MSDSPKKRGAPKGNTNALKHGYYSPRYRPPTNPSPGDLAIAAQIDVLVLYIHQVRILADQIETAEGKLGFYRVLAFAMSSLNRLIRAQQRVCGTQLEKANLASSLDESFYQIYLQALAADNPPTPAPEPSSPPAP